MLAFVMFQLTFAVVTTALLSGSIADRSSELAPEVRALDHDIATIILTSGTTGAPKGVMHTFGAFAWAVDAGLKRIPMTHSDRMLSYLPLAHVVERTLVERTLAATGGNRTHAAEMLGVSLRTVRNKIRQYGLAPRQLN